MSEKLNLPHLEPLRFAKEVIKLENNKSKVFCEFPFIPTLAMLCEASAQSCASYNTNKDEQKIGFLVSLKNITLNQELKDLAYIVSLERILELGEISEYNFEVIKNETIYASGSLTIILGK